MIRTALRIGALALALAGCASARRTPAGSASRVEPVFSTEEQKILACLDLQDHIVDLYTAEYESREGVRMTRVERAAFRNGWAEDLAKRGTFEVFEQSCFASLTPRGYQCGMQSVSTRDLAECMKPRV
jgi:hypothetical protein